MTKEQLNDVAENFTTKNRRVPKAKEFVELVNDESFTVAKANAFLARYRKNIVQLTVINGKLFDKDGTVVWYQNTRGSMMPASYYPDEGIGQYVSL